MNENTVFPSRLIEIKEFLIKKGKGIELSEVASDPRFNSAIDKEKIVEVISEEFDNITRADTTRDWYDFYFEENGRCCPVNIKVSDTKTADNLNCKLGVYYALTGKFPKFNNEIKWNEFFRELKEGLALADNDRDYYFLIYNKQNQGDVFIASLRSLSKIVPNGNNLPFQARWSENRQFVCRSYKEAKEFILCHLAQSLKLRSEACKEFLQYFPEFRQ